MKNTFKFLAKVTLVIVLFTGSVFTFSTLNVSTISEAKAAVSEQQVYSYLVARGYQVITLNPLAGSKYNWIAHTVKGGVHYMTTVYCNSEVVIGHEDVQF